MIRHALLVVHLVIVALIAVAVPRSVGALVLELSPEDVEEAVTLKHVLPEIARAVA